MCVIFRLNPPSRPNKAGLKCPSACLSVRPMHDGMQYDPIQGQGQGHKPLKVGNLAIFISCPIYNGGWQMTTDS